MRLNAEEFERRSDELYASSYLTSAGIVQNVALGILAYKFFDSSLAPQICLQATASFLAILLLAHECSWWILLVRRTPEIIDTVFPYLLGAAELWTMSKVPNIPPEAGGWWFFALGVLAVIGSISLWINRSYCTDDVFVDCPWLKPLVLENLNRGIWIVGAGSILLFWMWIYQERISVFWKICVFIEIYALQIAMLIVSEKFMEGVQDEFKRQLAVGRA